MTSKTTKRALLSSALAIVLCLAMLIGSTFAWFTDTASTGVNKIQAGNLKMEVTYKNTKDGGFTEVNKETPVLNNSALWEPGHVEYAVLNVKNVGSLALKYQLGINIASETGSTNVNGDAFKLSDYIKFGVANGDLSGKTRSEMVATVTDSMLISAGAYSKGNNLNTTNDADTVTLVVWMPETVGNEANHATDAAAPVINLGISVVATQATVEEDSFDNTYDKDAAYPVTSFAGLKTALASGGIVTVASDVTADETKTATADRVKITKVTTINLEGKYIVPGELEDSNNWAALYISADTTINASKSGGINCLNKTDPSASYIGGPYAAHIAGDDITVTVNGGTYYAGGTVFNVQKGTLIVNGGFFSVAPDIDKHDYRYLLNCVDANYKNGTAKIIVYGGTFVNFDPSNNTAEGAGTNFVADGYKVVSETQSNGDIWYTVVAE